MTPAADLLSEFRDFPVLQGLPEEHLAWLASQAEVLEFEPGEQIFRVGDPALSMVFFLKGEIHVWRDGAGHDGPVYIGRAGEVGGVLPYSRMTHYLGTGRAILPTRVAQVSSSIFPEMLVRMPELGQRLVGAMSDRIRESTKAEQQRDRLMALGKLSAGLAHELNNPAAAARRAASSLLEALTELRDLNSRLESHALSTGQRQFLNRQEETASRDAASAQPLDSLAQSEREEELASWLDRRRVEDGWKLASAFVESGIDLGKLDLFSEALGDGPILGDALKHLSATLTVTKLAQEIENSVTRISELVRAVKEYSFMDQVAQREIDVHQGIESTLTILGHRLKNGISIERAYDPALPRVCAHGTELNQVWTNLIDNAIDAMAERPDGARFLRIRTRQEPGHILVEIADSGAGIPGEIEGRVFDPFFTTKDVGEGTGLGLDIVRRIVRQHQGSIRFESKPGETTFQVRLPQRAKEGTVG